MSEIRLLSAFRTATLRHVNHPRYEPLRLWRGTGGLKFLTAVIGGLVLLPVVYLVIRALGAGQDGLAYVFSARTLEVLGNSIVLMVAVVIGAVGIGVPFAWLTTRSDLPLRRVWLIGGMLIMVVPSYIGAMMVITAFGPRGLLQQLLEPMGVERIAPIYGFFGAWCVLTLYCVPYIVLPVRAALLHADPALEEAARSMGVRGSAIFWRVTMPLLRPAIGAGALLTALYALSDFGAVALMRYDAFTRVIYAQYTNSFDRSRAALLALLLIGLTVALLLIERRSLSRRRMYRTGVGSQHKARVVLLKRWKVPAILFCATLVGVGSVLPLVILTHWVVRGVNAGINLDSLTLETFNTASVSLIAAVVIAVLSLAPALLAFRSRRKVDQWLVGMTYLGNGVPSIVVALALVFFASNVTPALYQTMPILIVGYTIRFLPIGVGAMRSALMGVSPRFEEVGRTLGLHRWQLVRRVTIPLARSGILAGLALAFLSAMKELPTTLLLAPTGFRTLPVEIWMANSDGRFAEVGAPTLLLVLVGAVSLSLMFRGKDR